jgi:hypothetical protein
MERNFSRTRKSKKIGSPIINHRFFYDARGSNMGPDLDPEPSKIIETFLMLLLSASFLLISHQ